MAGPVAHFVTHAIPASRDPSAFNAEQMKSLIKMVDQAKGVRETRQ